MVLEQCLFPNFLLIISNLSNENLPQSFDSYKAKQLLQKLIGGLKVEALFIKYRSLIILLRTQSLFALFVQTGRLKVQKING